MRVITLVHGTFGRLPGSDAGWTRTASALRQTLSAELGDDTTFSVFRWSGMNLPSARYRAGARLRSHLRETAAAHPDARHYVVAHSHGGNVALYALRGLTDPPVDGVVCLSTPFIAAQPREPTAFRFVATYTVFLVTLFAFVANAMGALLAPWVASIDPGHAVRQALALNEVWLEFLLCALVAWHATGRLLRLARARLARIVVPSVSVPLCIMRSVGDEASALLATSSFFSWLVTLAWGLASRLTAGLAALFAAIALSPLLVLSVPVLVAERLLGGARMRRFLRSLLTGRTALAVIATFGTLLVFAAWGYLLADTPFGTAERWYGAITAGLLLAAILSGACSGLGYGLTAPFLEVTAEATPIGDWRVRLVPARDTTRPTASFLAHSVGYVDPDVLRSVAAWIGERERFASRERIAR